MLLEDDLVIVVVVGDIVDLGVAVMIAVVDVDGLVVVVVVG